MQTGRYCSGALGCRCCAVLLLAATCCFDSKLCPVWLLLVSLHWSVSVVFHSTLTTHIDSLTHSLTFSLTLTPSGLQVGQVSLDYEDDGRSMSSETRQLVEDEVRKLVQVRLSSAGLPVSSAVGRALHQPGGGAVRAAGAC